MKKSFIFVIILAIICVTFSIGQISVYAQDEATDAISTDTPINTTEDSETVDASTNDDSAINPIPAATSVPDVTTASDDDTDVASSTPTPSNGPPPPPPPGPGGGTACHFDGGGCSGSCSPGRTCTPMAGGCICKLN